MYICIRKYMVWGETSTVSRVRLDTISRYSYYVKKIKNTYIYIYTYPNPKATIFPKHYIFTLRSNTNPSTLETLNPKSFKAQTLHRLNTKSYATSGIAGLAWCPLWQDIPSRLRRNFQSLDTRLRVWALEGEAYYPRPNPCYLNSILFS